MYDITDFNTEKGIGSLDKSCSWIILGPPGSGKSTFIEDLVYFNQQFYPTCKVNTNPIKPYKRYCEIFPEIFVSRHFDIETEKKFIKRQKDLEFTNHPGKMCVYILDDIKKAKGRDEYFEDLFKQGSRHYNLLTIVVDQYALGFPPPIRTSASYIAIFKFTVKADRERLYKNFGGETIFGNEKTFNDILDKYTGNYGCLIIKQNGESSSLEKCVFHYRSTPRGKWKFNTGNKALWEYSEKRCDPKKTNYDSS